MASSTPCWDWFAIALCEAKRMQFESVTQKALAVRRKALGL
jgi:hypothetical protein